jgi:hypothetical protein
MEITIDTNSETRPTSGYVQVLDKRYDGLTFSTETIVSGLSQEVDGIPVDFIEAVEGIDRGETEEFGEGLE